MDIRTEVQLCMVDLVEVIEAGDFRRLAEAERAVKAFAASAPNDAWRGAMLGRLAEALGNLASPAEPEVDALLRAVRATVRRRLQSCFDCRPA